MTNTIFQPFRFNHGITWLIKALLFLQLPPHATAQSDATAPPPNPFSFNPKFNSSMAIIMVILVSAFFFLGFFSVYIRQCAARRMRRGFNPDTIGGGTRQVARGLDVEIIETFPTFIYSAVKGLKIGKGSLECAVCLNEFEDDETLRLLPKCNHVFHHDCIDAWLVTQSTCPVCRANLIPKPGESHTIHLRLDSDSESVEPGCTPNRDESINQVSIHVDVDDDIQSVSHVKSPIAMNRPPRSRSTGFKLSGIFPRSHSTGHSLVRPGENYERFTLRLPEEVRTQIVNSSLNRTKSCVAFQRVRSSRRSYRSGSVGSSWGKNYYERFDGDTKTDRWGLSMTPPFISRNGSVRSMKVSGGEEVTATSNNLIKSVKSPFEWLFPGVDGNSGSERLFDRPRSDGPI